MSSDWLEVKQDIEGKIRAGQLREAGDTLVALYSRELPRESLLDLANLARRAGIPDLAIRILGPIVRPRVPLNSLPATPRERIAYAAVLARVGAVTEAANLLREVMQELGEQTPADAFIQLAFVQIYKWDYHGAIPNLERFLALVEESSYECAVAKLNLASAYGFAGFDVPASARLAQEVLTIARERSWRLLEQGALDIIAQHAITAGEWSTARQALDQALEISTDTSNLLKWEALLEVSRKPGAKSLSRLEDVRADGVRFRRWELVRDCDYHRSLVFRDRELMSRVYFGTPFNAYRFRILTEARRWYDAPSSYGWQLQAAEKGAEPFDLDLATLEANSMGLTALERLPHHLLLALASDFYRPFSVAGLFMQLHRDEYYHPTYSYNRIQSSLFRLRKWIEDNQLPLKIEMKSGMIRLLPSAPCRLIVRAQELIETSGVQESARLWILRDAWPYQAFTTKEAAGVLGCSERKTLELLKWARSSGSVHQVGKGRGTFFRFLEKEAA